MKHRPEPACGPRQSGQIEPSRQLRYGDLGLPRAFWDMLDTAMPPCMSCAKSNAIILSTAHHASSREMGAKGARSCQFGMSYLCASSDLGHGEPPLPQGSRPAAKRQKWGAIKHMSRLYQ